MCRHNFNPRPLDKITSKVEIDFKKSKKDRKKAFKDVPKNCLKCQKDKTPPASKKIYELMNCKVCEQYHPCHNQVCLVCEKPFNEGRKDVFAEVEKIMHDGLSVGKGWREYVIYVKDNFQKLKGGQNDNKG